MTRKGKGKAAELTLNVSRSSRSNKFDGFKIRQVTDTKKKPSKVKPRVVPDAVITKFNDVHIPPTTPMEVIQQVGIQQMCHPTRGAL